MSVEKLPVDVGSHAFLVARAAQWLKNTRKCAVVLSEHVGGYSETPDAIGWKCGGRHSILVECKNSRADFFRDKKKIWRSTLMEHDALGMQRYYMFPKGLFLDYSMVNPKWGILELSGNRVKVIRDAFKHVRSDFSLKSEISLLWSKLRKLQVPNVR